MGPDWRLAREVYRNHVESGELESQAVGVVVMKMEFRASLALATRSGPLDNFLSLLS